jgi:hypothetical protein
LTVRIANSNILKNAKESLRHKYMQELLTAITYPVVWLICSHVLKIESGLAKLLISLTAAILVYVLIGIKRSADENNKKEEK